MRIVFAVVVVFSGVVSGVCAGGCSTLFPPPDTNFVWVDDLAAEQLAPTAYKIRGNDRLQVTVFKQEALSGEVLVREDGQITVPLVGDVAVIGKTPPEAANEIGARLSNTGFIDKPSVSVAVLETRAPSFAVVGQVKQPGSFELQPGTTVLDGIALAGGLDEFADKEKIFVLRKRALAPVSVTPVVAAAPPDGTAPEAPAGAPVAAAAAESQSRIRFSWAKLSRSDGNGLRFRIEDGDVVVVE